MAFGFNKSKTPPIAIDFGADTIKLLQIAPPPGSPQAGSQAGEADGLSHNTINGNPEIIAASVAVIPDSARKDASLRLQFISDALKMMFKEQPFRGRRVICSIPAFHTLTHNVEMPANVSASGSGNGNGEDDYVNPTEAINDHLRSRFNINPSRSIVRHIDAGNVSKLGQTRRECIVFAVKREQVMQYVELADALKLDVAGMHTEPAAILETFSKLYQRREADLVPTCYLDIGAASTKVIIAHGPHMVFAKTIHAASDTLTRRHAETNRLDFIDAREQRIQMHQAGAEDFSFDQGGTATATLTRRASDTETSLNDDFNIEPSEHPCPVTAAIIDELKLCLRYYDQMFADQPVQKLIFLGGEANDRQHCRDIAQAVNIKGSIGDPFARLTRPIDFKPNRHLNPNQPQPGWAVPLGLCLLDQD